MHQPTVCLDISSKVLNYYALVKPKSTRLKVDKDTGPTASTGLSEVSLRLMNVSSFKLAGSYSRSRRKSYRSKSEGRKVQGEVATVAQKAVRRSVPDFECTPTLYYLTRCAYSLRTQ